ncbi:MAG TPA: class I SAM-dependent methyltransferase [Verrucomicrobiae bacterium]
MKSTTQEMLAVNVEQASFYDSISEAEDRTGKDGYSNNRSANIMTRSWSALRARQRQAASQSGVAQAEIQFQEKWIAKKKGGDFLEIGCFRGSSVSMKMVEASRHYTGLELSPKAAEVFRGRIKSAGLTEKGTVIATDFLAWQTEQKFDLIYAHGVLHHFADPEPVFQRIASLLKPDGVLLFTEPCAVNPLFRVARAAYRPFQTDKAWEWPFSSKTVSLMERHLTPVDGFGWGRHSLPLSVFVGLPVINTISHPLYLRTVKKEIASGWHRNIWNNSTVAAVYSRKKS